MWKLGQRPCNSFSGNICLKFSVLCLCSARVENPDQVLSEVYVANQDWNPIAPIFSQKHKILINLEQGKHAVKCQKFLENLTVSQRFITAYFISFYTPILAYVKHIILPASTILLNQFS
jgi:hypothetical protein